MALLASALGMAAPSFLFLPKMILLRKSRSFETIISLICLPAQKVQSSRKGIQSSDAPLVKGENGQSQTWDDVLILTLGDLMSLGAFLW